MNDVDKFGYTMLGFLLSLIVMKIIPPTNVYYVNSQEIMDIQANCKTVDYVDIKGGLISGYHYETYVKCEDGSSYTKNHNAKKPAFTNPFF